MANPSLWLGYDIEVNAGPTLQPKKIVSWKDYQFKKTQPESPFHYKADALVGLALIHLNQHLKNPFSSPNMNFSFAHDSWLSFEPHYELFSRSQPRIQALKNNIKQSQSNFSESFERSFGEILDTALQPWGIDLQALHDALDAIDFFETKSGRPLLYNFSLGLTRATVEKLHYLHSLLFNLRALLAMDFNAYIQDSSHEALKMDSISDYLSRAEYVANDALLYWSFKKLKDSMPEATQKKMEDSFRNYSHNGFCLVESLPKSFLNSLSSEQLEESLYLVQMDWLLGTEAGLLFRCREELYGLSEGYEKIFWTDLIEKTPQVPHTLSVNCMITEKDVFPTLGAA